MSLEVTLFPTDAMVYDWEGKEDVCYRMYIDDKRSLEDIMEYMKTEHNFAPRYCRPLFPALSIRSVFLPVTRRAGVICVALYSSFVTMEIWATAVFCRLIFRFTSRDRACLKAIAVFAEPTICPRWELHC